MAKDERRLRCATMSKLLAQLSLINYDVLRAHRPSVLAVAAQCLALHLIAHCLPEVAYVTEKVGGRTADAVAEVNAALMDLHVLHDRAARGVEYSAVMETFRMHDEFNLTSIAPSAVLFQL